MMKMPWEFQEQRPKGSKPMGARASATFIYNFNGACWYCEQPIEVLTPKHARHPTRDHKLPKARGGVNKDNVVLACVGCNHVKADMTEDEFRYFMATGELAPSYVAWLTTRFRKAARTMGLRLGKSVIGN